MSTKPLAVLEIGYSFFCFDLWEVIHYSESKNSVLYGGEGIDMVGELKCTSASANILKRYSAHYRGFRL